MKCTGCGKPVTEDQILCLTCEAEEELRRQTKEEADESQARYDSSLVGVRGWLAFFCVGTGILGPIGILQELGTFPELLQATHGDAVLVTVTWGLLGLMVILIASSVGVALGLALQKPWAPRVTKIFLIAVPSLFWMLVLAASAAAKLAGLAGIWKLESLLGICGTTISCGLWYWYFSVSRRVTMTYAPHS